MKKLLALSLLIATVSCDEAATVAGGATIAGTYTLQSVNGDPLPSNFTDNGTTIQITAGTFTVTANGTFSYSETWSSGTDVTTGTWTLNGDTYTFVPTPTQQDPNPTNGYGTLSGTTLTLTVTETGQAAVVRILTKN